MLTSVSECLANLAIDTATLSKAAFASIVDNNGIELIVAMLKTATPEITREVNTLGSAACG